jgi:hypothetical protein
MDPRRPQPTDRAPLDDAALALAIRNVVDDWSLPPQRLDAQTWRDRVDRRRRAGDGGLGGRGRRLILGAAAVLIVATVSLSFAAGWLKVPRTDQGSVLPSPSAGASSIPAPSGSALPIASPMPKLSLNGDLPTPSRVMVRTGQGYNLVDLATGELGPVVIPVGYGPTAVLARPGGGWLCVCGDGQNVIQLSLRTIDANGAVGEPQHLKDVVGTADPGVSRDLQPLLASVRTSASPDGRFALIGWASRDGAAGWRIGVDVLDLETLATVASTEFLVDEPAARDGRPLVRQAPSVRLSPAGDRILLASIGNSDMSGQLTNEGTDHWLAAFDGRSIGAPAPAGSTKVKECIELDAGLIDVGPSTDGAVYYTVCTSPDRPFSVDRVAADGRLVSAADLPGILAGIDGGIVARPSGDVLYSWDPFASVLSSLDLRSGELSVGAPQLPNPKGRTGPADLIVVSVDGTRVYTLGIGSEDGSTASAGVFAFDGSTLAPVGHWAPQADLTSISVSEDGQYVYAAAAGGEAPDGAPAPEFGASITVYDTSDGSVVLLAGRLGAHDLTLSERTCQ